MKDKPRLKPAKSIVDQNSKEKKNIFGKKVQKITTKYSDGSTTKVKTVSSKPDSEGKYKTRVVMKDKQKGLLGARSKTKFTLNKNPNANSMEMGKMKVKKGILGLKGTSTYK
jgi:hypothetical protein